MNRKPTLSDVDDSLGILSSFFTIVTTVIGTVALAGGTLGVEELNLHLLQSSSPHLSTYI